MQIAQINDGAITAVQVIQRRPFYNVGRWWDLRDDAVLAEWMIELGYQEVVSTPRPTDDSTNWVKDVQMVDGVPTEVWTPVALTPEELQAQQESLNQQQLVTDVKLDDQKIKDAIAALKILLGDSTTAGSIRAWKSPITNNANVTGAQAKALADLLISTVQENRRLARQLLRIEKLVIGDFSSTDVGTE